MKTIKLWVLYLLFVGVSSVAVVPVVFAQALPELTEAYAFGDLVVRYPETWAIEPGETLTLATNRTTLNDALNGISPSGDNVVFTFLTPANLVNIGIDSRTQPDVAITAMMHAADFHGLPEEYPEIGIPAASAYVFGDVMEYGQLVAVQFNGSIVMVAIEFTSDPRDYAELVTHIISAMRYDGQFAGEVTAAAGDAEATASSETEIRQWARAATGTSQFGEQGWGFGQATGEPNTVDCGDHSTAWASRSSTGADRLNLTFDQAVIPTQVNIYQTYNPGSIIGVELFNVETGETVGIPNSVDPPGNTACPGIFSLDISNIDAPVNGVVIYLDQEIGGGWNEIDAVELVGTEATEPAPTPVLDTVAQWANYATGSSEYSSEGWSFMRATGEPDVGFCQDSTWAWASATSTSSEILALEFEQAVIPTQVNIYQTYNPGSITRIELTNTDTSTIIPVPNSADSPGNTPCPGIFTVDISGVDTPVNGVVIYLDQSIVGDWNEVDAVELVGVDEGSTAVTIQPTPQSTVDSTSLDAGDLDVSEVFAFDGATHLTINYPAGWITDVGQLPAIASSEDALAALQRGAPLPEGEIAIGILPPADLPNVLGVEAGATAEATLKTLGGVFGGELAIESVESLTYPAAITPLVGTTRLPADTRLLAVEHSSGVITFVILTDDLDGYLPMITEMIASLSMQ